MTTSKPKEVEKLDAEKQARHAEFMAKIRTSPLGNAAFTIKKLFRHESPDLVTLTETLGKQLQDVSKNNQNFTMETMLLNQAQTLQAIFYYAAETIPDCRMVNQVQLYADIAIKANNGCRKTLLALNQIKNPASATFIKQQNNAINQQVNNDNAKNENLKNSEKNSNELLGEINHESLDTRSQSQTGRDYSPLEAVAESGS